MLQKLQAFLEMAEPVLNLKVSLQVLYHKPEVKRNNLPTEQGVPALCSNFFILKMRLTSKPLSIVCKYKKLSFYIEKHKYL